METTEAISLMPALYFGAIIVGGVFRFMIWGVRRFMRFL